MGKHSLPRKVPLPDFANSCQVNALKFQSGRDDVTSEERVETGSAPVIPRARSTQGVICLPARPISGATVTLLRRSPLAPGASSRKEALGGTARVRLGTARVRVATLADQDRPQLKSTRDQNQDQQNQDGDGCGRAHPGTVGSRVSNPPQVRWLRPSRLDAETHECLLPSRSVR